MANQDNPIGCRPLTMVDGSQIPVRRYPVDASNGTAIFVGDLVTAEADGNVAPSAANDGILVLGVVVQILDTNEIPIGHPNAAVSTKYLTASTAGFVLVALAVPNALFVIQSDAGTTVAETARFATANHIAGAGDVNTHGSRHELDTSDIGTGLQFRIMDKVDDPGNAWGEGDVDLIVMFNESVWKGAGTATI